VKKRIRRKLTKRFLAARLARGYLILKSELPTKDVLKIRKEFDGAVKGSVNTFRAPITGNIRKSYLDVMWPLAKSYGFRWIK